ncbi:MAG: phosphoglucosamine mutase [Planctomycetota bacterium]|nr:phosphoglucosamine mutase [Planctomycetota bacterium]
MTPASFVPPVFGTDGLRGKAGEPPLDPTTMQRVGAALGIWLQKHGPEQKRVILGHDGRESAAWISACLTQGLAATDASVIDVGLIPTPGLAYLTRTEPVQAGIMISASHNPGGDNGVKIFQGDGCKLPDEDEQELSRLTVEVPFEPIASARSKPRRELGQSYQEHLANVFAELDLTGHKIVVDTANGAGSTIAPSVLRCFGADTIAIACEPNGHNINDGVGAMHSEHLAQAVRDHGAEFGFCLDGDGDRCMFADQTGQIWDGDAVLTLMGRHLAEQGKLPENTVVATIMSNLGLHKALALHGIKVHSTPVGDRAVVAAMRDSGFALGGEQSGHIIFAGEGQFTGDGLYTALAVMSIPGVWDRGFAQTFEDFESFPQLLVNVPVRKKSDLSTIDSIQSAVRTVEDELGEQGRVVLRYSGTEDLCRVMVEGPNFEIVQQHTDCIVRAVQAELGV